MCVLHFHRCGIWRMPKESTEGVREGKGEREVGEPKAERKAGGHEDGNFPIGPEKAVRLRTLLSWRENNTFHVFIIKSASLARNQKLVYSLVKYKVLRKHSFTFHFDGLLTPSNNFRDLGNSTMAIGLIQKKKWMICKDISYLLLIIVMLETFPCECYVTHGVLIARVAQSVRIRLWHWVA